MRIGELAERVGTSTRALRHYESLGLIEARRRANGYRDYDDSDVRVIEEIRSLLSLGFALEDTRPFIDCLRAGNDTGDSCPDSRAVYRRKLAEVDAYLVRLHAVRDQLAAQLRTTGSPGCEFDPPTTEESHP